MYVRYEPDKSHVVHEVNGQGVVLSNLPSTMAGLFVNLAESTRLVG